MKKISNTPKRKRLRQTVRLESATLWIRDFKGKNIIGSYSKWFGVDKPTAIKELRMKGIEISEEKERQIIASLRYTKAQRMSRIDRIEGGEGYDKFSDGEYYFIAGYTSNGVPFGIKHDEIQSNTSEE